MRHTLILIPLLLFTFHIAPLLSAEVGNTPPMPLYRYLEFSMIEDTPGTWSNVSTFFSDPDGDEIDLLMKNEAGELGRDFYGVIVRAELVPPVQNSTSWSLRITPLPDKYGWEFLELYATDGKDLSEGITINVSVMPVNDPPVILGVNSEGSFEMELMEELTCTGQFLAVDEKDGDEVYFSVQFLEGINLFEVNSTTGEFTWTPTQWDVGCHEVLLTAQDTNGGSSTAIFWFNVSNKPDLPQIVYIEVNGRNYSYPDKNFVINLTVKEGERILVRVHLEDDDVQAGVQDEIEVYSSLTDFPDYSLKWINPLSYLLISVTIPSYLITNPPYIPPLNEWIEFTDPGEEVGFRVNLHIVVENVPDPPEGAMIITPEGGATLPILFHNMFEAANATDPDLRLGDRLTYIWDFNASDGFQRDAEGRKVYWDFPHAGVYIVTLRVYDTTGLYDEAKILVEVKGVYSTTDYDNDGLPNAWEINVGLDIYSPESDEDPDKDALTNLEEYRLGTHPLVSDTDGDGYLDGYDAYPLDGRRWRREDEARDYPYIYILFVAIVLLILTVLLRAYIRKREMVEKEREKRMKEIQKIREEQKRVLMLYGEE
ncbi:MAG: hypothetical protein J7L88_03610 [Thermoplasmata archaeon]|nr:hypothetical protein [Thermoplasmata archaeon]